jgi:site-specific recombinase XerD
MGDRHWAAPRGLRYPLAAAHDGSPHLQQTGNLRAVQILLGHTKIETTDCYLGVQDEDALALAEATEV